jgi:hypothetical protein
MPSKRGPNADGELKGYDEWMMCNRPDHDADEIRAMLSAQRAKAYVPAKCGYPFPCPHHTIDIDLTGPRIEVRFPQSFAATDPRTVERVGTIAAALAKSKLRAPPKARQRRSKGRGGA